MNGLGLGPSVSRKQAGIGGAAAIAVGVGLILLPAGGSPGSSRHVSAADVAARVASTSLADGGPSSASSSPSPAATSVSSSAAVASSPAGHSAPPAATTTVTQAGPDSSAAQPPQPSQPSSDPASSASRASTKPSAAPSSHPPTSAPPSSAPPAGCASGSGSSSDAFAPIAGVAHTSCWGVTAEATADDPSRGGDQDLGNLADGAWAEYPHVDFGSGATQFLGRVASGAPAGISGRVEVHMDSLTSAPAAIFEIANTGGWQSWRTVPMNMNRTTGVHDVYVTFDSGQPQAFVSMHWFDFGN